MQKNDARTRVHLGGRYETILTKFMTPLNVRLLENNLSNVELVENQNDFAGAKTLFNNDYINYQQDLEELVSMDCKKEPAAFYEKLDKAYLSGMYNVMDLLTFDNSRNYVINGVKVDVYDTAVSGKQALMTLAVSLIIGGIYLTAAYLEFTKRDRN